MSCWTYCYAFFLCLHGGDKPALVFKNAQVIFQNKIEETYQLYPHHKMIAALREPFWEKKCCMCEYAKKKGCNMLLTPKTDTVLIIITIIMLCNSWIVLDCAWFPPCRTLYPEFRSCRCEFCNYQTHPGPFTCDDSISTCMMGRWVSA